MSEHKRCPFCGGEPEPHSYISTKNFVLCALCRNGTAMHEKMSDAWAAWDRRDDAAGPWNYNLDEAPDGELLYLKRADDAAVKALVGAAKALLARDEINTCQHEETYRGGSIWEICSQCGDMWADDRGGKPKWQDPPEWTSIRRAIKKVEGV